MVVKSMFLLVAKDCSCAHRYEGRVMLVWFPHGPGLYVGLYMHYRFTDHDKFAAHLRIVPHLSAPDPLRMPQAALFACRHLPTYGCDANACTHSFICLVGCLGHSVSSGVTHTATALMDSSG
jgi:hypothetical protein